MISMHNVLQSCRLFHSSYTHTTWLGEFTGCQSNKQSVLFSQGSVKLLNGVDDFTVAKPFQTIPLQLYEPGRVHIIIGMA